MSAKKKASPLLYHVICILLVGVMCYPIIWLFFSAFKEKSEIFGAFGDLLPWICTDPICRSRDLVCLRDCDFDASSTSAYDSAVYALQQAGMDQYLSTLDRPLCGRICILYLFGYAIYARDSH